MVVTSDPDFKVTTFLKSSCASDSMFYPLTLRVTNCFYHYDYMILLLGTKVTIAH